MLVHVPCTQVANCDMSSDVVSSLTPAFAEVGGAPANVNVRGWMFDWDTKDQIR